MMNDRIKIVRVTINDAAVLSVIAATTIYDTYGIFNKPETIWRIWLSDSALRKCARSNWEKLCCN